MGHLRGLPLASLDLSYCTQLCDADMAGLQGHSLDFLGLEGCPCLSDSCFEYFMDMSLEVGVKCLGCRGVTALGLAALLSKAAANAKVKPVASLKTETN